MFPAWCGTGSGGVSYILHFSILYDFVQFCTTLYNFVRLLALLLPIQEMEYALLGILLNP
jgi:hypothetical protein